MSSLQSAGQAHGGPAGYQTDTRHIRAELSGRKGGETDQQRSDLQTQRKFSFAYI